MEETSKKSLITLIEIIIILVVLYLLAGYITGYLEGLEEAELVVTAAKTFALI